MEIRNDRNREMGPRSIRNLARRRHIRKDGIYWMKSMIVNYKDRYAAICLPEIYPKWTYMIFREFKVTGHNKSYGWEYRFTAQLRSVGGYQSVWTTIIGSLQICDDNQVRTQWYQLIGPRQIKRNMKESKRRSQIETALEQMALQVHQVNGSAVTGGPQDVALKLPDFLRRT